MIRAIQVVEKWYVEEITTIEEDAQNIRVSVEEGKPVIIVNDVGDLRELLGDDVKIVEVPHD